MKSIILFLLLFSLTYVYANAAENSQYSGTYSYDLNPGHPEGRYGHVTIKHARGNTYTFTMDLGRGAPSYNTGELEGDITINNAEAIFYRKSEYLENKACEWKMIFSDKKLTIVTLNQHLDCEFGYGVYVDGEYEKR